MIDVDLEKETDETTLLSHHFFGKLPISPDFTIDNNKKSGKEGKGRNAAARIEIVLTGDYGDTSIGIT